MPRPRPYPHQIEHAAAALAAILAGREPADATLNRYFRERPALGGGDRAFVSKAVFAVLRRRRSLEWAAAGAAPRLLILAFLLREEGVALPGVRHLLADAEVPWAVAAAARREAGAPPAVLADLPDWIAARMLAHMTEPEVLALGASLREPAPLDLRVNLLRASRDEVLRSLAADGIGGEPTPFSPAGIRLAGKPQLQRHPLFLGGAFEVQDEGSQLLGYLLDPRPGERVVDFCAGAGGKTLLCGALMESSGRVYALDVSERRLASLAPRLRRSGLSNVHAKAIRDERDERLERWRAKADRVLVDAPCSGLGTARRNPELKWRLTPAALDELAAKQLSILGGAARLVRPGGRLVYATCSMLREENEDVVARFLGRRQDFAARPCGPILAARGIPIEAELHLRLSPAIHHTDGFFAAVLERAERAGEADRGAGVSVGSTP